MWLVAIVEGKRKNVEFRNIDGRAVGDLAQIGFVSQRDFRVLLGNKSLVKNEGKWYLVIHDGITNKEKVRETILKYIN